MDKKWRFVCDISVGGYRYGMEKENDYELNLSDRPDGVGYFYGQLRTKDGVHQVNVMPPEPHWAGEPGMKPTGEFAPDPAQYILYVDGEEIARVKALAEVTALSVMQMIDEQADA